MALVSLSVGDSRNGSNHVFFLLVVVLLVSLLFLTYLVLHKVFIDWNIMYYLRVLCESIFEPVPSLHVPLPPAPSQDNHDKSSSLSSPSLTIPSCPDTLQCYNPGTNEWIGSVPAMTPAQVHECCQKAATAQRDWARTTFAQRRRVLRTLQKYVLQHVHDICLVASLDSGKPVLDALLGEVLTTCEKIRTLQWNGQLWLQPQYRSTGPLMVHKTAMVEYVPLGVLATIAPWNYPFHNYVNHILSGLFAGNAVVGKVSEHTSYSAVAYFTAMCQQALVVHGHSPDLVQTITGLGVAGEALVSDPLVDKIIFTGSPQIGRLVMKTASQFLKPVILELGGKDAMVILDDCQLKTVMPWVMRGCFQNAGQNCVGIERVLVYERLYDEFLTLAVERVKALRQGPPLQKRSSRPSGDGPDHLGSYYEAADVDVGAMVTPQQLDIIQALVDDAVKKGARVLCGGNYKVLLQNGNTNGKEKANCAGNFYPPTVLADVTPDMDIFQHEVFGPVMTVVKVPNNDDAACLELVNGTVYGLGSSVYCGDAARGLRLGRQIRSGMLCINDFGSNYLIQSLPFGGVKDSGFGRFAGIEGLRACCLERSIVVDRIPGVRTSIPPPLDYPIDNVKSMGFGTSLLQVLYSESWMEKIKGIVGLIKFG